jgi:hypothetical protein
MEQKTNQQIIEELKAIIKKESKKRCSAYIKGILIYADELLEQVQDDLDYCQKNGIEWNYDLNKIDRKSFEKLFLNGADNWNDFSYGGCSLIYDYEIALRLCTPSELKRKKEGSNNPNRNQNWLDLQTIALRRAFANIWRYYQYDVIKQDDQT